MESLSVFVKLSTNLKERKRERERERERIDDSISIFVVVVFSLYCTRYCKMYLYLYIALGAHVMPIGYECPSTFNLCQALRRQLQVPLQLDSRCFSAEELAVCHLFAFSRC